MDDKVRADFALGDERAQHLVNVETGEADSLFDKPEEIIISKNLKPKFELMYEFKKLADSYKLGMSLKTNKYFKTHNCKKNIFIWHYSPQSEYDKAPTI